MGEQAEKAARHDGAADTETAQMDPNMAMAYFGRARIYEAWGRYEAAISDFEKAVELEPGDAEAEQALQRCRNAQARRRAISE